MRKNENPNFINVRPEGIPWKLGFFFLWGFLLFSNPLFAFGETDSEALADSINVHKKAQPEAVLYIQKGAFVYGMENITQTIADSPITEKSTPKTLPKKKKTAVKKKEAKQKAEPKLPEPEISVVLSTHPSEEFFSRSNNYGISDLKISCKNSYYGGFYCSVFKYKSAPFLYTIFHKRYFWGAYSYPSSSLFDLR
ncbi:hypothetical protein [Chryseobacterium sp.]|uniref:hypothetical protein n=1 Tax=Chryseobacterium sp. TaxID=1871047 RepID=UPI0012BEE11B|nr:hypothetical protein [Chryseobacterium sp.]MPS63456.1 hypothetical protein [Chryseobacterium sp.]